jgi:two-component system OmpR family sensor kinase
MWIVHKVWNNDQFLNLIVINKNNNQLIFSNVTNNLKISFVKDLLKSKNYTYIVNDNWLLIKKQIIKQYPNVYEVLYIKKLHYSFTDYIIDLTEFIWISLLFSILFYIIGGKFVSRILVPVQNSIKDMQDFIDNAWHELKTPISIIYSNLQLINEIKTYEKKLIDEGIEETKKLNNLIDSLVELTNINKNNSSENLNINLEVKWIIEDFEQKLNSKNIKLQIQYNYNKIIFINKQYFYILFSNLLANAIRYSKNNSNIEIILNNKNFIIKDSGIWISKMDQDKIFDRFFMSNSSRNGEWHWIWLSLVKKVANIYKWKIIVKSELEVGTEFIIKY